MAGDHGNRRERRRGGRARPRPVGDTSQYRDLVNPFEPLRVLTHDQVDSLHDAALTLLEDLGIRVLLAEARELFAAAGTRLDGDMVYIDRELVAGALEASPSEVALEARNPARTVGLGGRSVVFVPVSGPPHVSDTDGGKRPGTLADYDDFVRLAQAFDVLHILGPSVEPQDVPTHLRHLHMTSSALTLSDKAPFVYARGRGQVADAFEMVRIAHGVDSDEFASAARCWTVINTNSPRQLDIPMCLGIIDFARAGQVSVITPFTLAGAMAPVTIAGALTLQHAEALAGITLAQLATPGAPVVYGAFTSNVDMRSGAPAFGTPEYFKASVAAGQLARHLGLPWRSSAPNASNTPDAQATYEHATSLWGAISGGANMILHAAGWLEGGLTASKEQLILDVEVLQTVAESFRPVAVTDDEIGLGAIAEVQPGGHFFGGTHTLERFQTAFYEPLVSDWSNYGQWTEAGGLDATQRANAIWKRTLAEFEAPPIDETVAAELAAFVERRTREGGAPPES
ncbi:MAG: trimethylamine methyltransferase family protein [Acidimicrobiia bacterium]|nr:trimethylamine methyltransferase family protein [Acidimicrobiia bacterium]